MTLDVQIIADHGAGSDFLAALAAQRGRLALTGQTALSPRTWLRSPSACVVFVTQLSAVHDSKLSAYLAAGVPVFPVIDTPAHAALLPTPLSGRNAFIQSRYGNNWADALCDEVLARAWLQRPERKLFLSYRRAESAEVARQLHDELTRLGFHVFLDEVSIDRSTNVRSALTWALNDVDAVVLLATAGVAQSQWVLDEIAFANTHSIGVIGVCWPASPLAPPGGPLAPDQCVDLGAAAPLATQLLSSQQLEDVLGAVFRHRAHAVKSRLDHLLPVARRRAAQLGPLSGASTLGDFVAGGSYVRVLPHRPDAEALHDTVLAAGPRTPNVICCYAECDPKHPSARALRWLFSSGPQRQLWTIP